MTVTKVTWKKSNGETGTAYRASVKLDDGRRIQRQFQTRREALDFARTPAAWNATAAPTERFGDAAQAWLDETRKGAGRVPVEPMTMVMYEGHVRNHILPVFGDRTWRSISPRSVEAFRDDLLGKVSRSTAKRVVNTFSRICRFAVRRGLTTYDPSDGVTVADAVGRHRDRSSQRIEIPNRDEVKKLIQTAQALAESTHKGRARAWQRYSLMLHLLVYAGLRASELRGLPRNCLVGGRLEVRQRADRQGRIGPPKSAAGYRSIPLPDSIRQSLDTHLQATTGKLAFGTSSDAPESHENLTKRMWLVVQERSGVVRYNLHSLRHFFASQLIAGGANALLVAKLLGHSDVSMTLNVYSHLFTDAAALAQEQAIVESIVLPTE